MTITVLYSPDIAFTHPISSSAAWKSSLVLCELLCFKGICKRNKAVELCGLIAALALGCSKGYMCALRLLH